MKTSFLATVRTELWTAAALLMGALIGAWLMPAGIVLGAPHTDLVGQFIPWRAFAADSLRAGDLPLWNPYTYSGQPFLGGFQSGLFYPPNLAFVMLPLDRALNFSIFLHLGLMGWGMAWWVVRRGLHPAAAAATGLTLALSGAVFPHVYAGHLSNLCTMAWAPWAFAGIELWARERKPGGLLLAGAAVALQILGGQMQYVFFFGVAAGVHAVVLSVAEPTARKRALPAVAIACALGAILAAAQLLPGLEAARDGVRQGKVGYAFASAFALPPENLLTAIAPGFFGDTDRGAVPYWGRAYFWEMSVYFGVAGLVFASLAWRDRERGRQAKWDFIVAGLLLVLALGRHLPFYRVLYDFVPGFDQFRGMSKFTFPATLFALLVVAAGIDAWLAGRVNRKHAGIACGLLMAGAAAAAITISGSWGIVNELGAWIRSHGNDDIIAPPTFPEGAVEHLITAIWRTAVICLALGAAMFLTVWRPGWRWVAVAILPLEMIDFARHQVATTEVSAAMPAAMREFVAKNPGDYRVLNLVRPNGGYLLGAPDIWGNDPGVLKRYAEFMTFSQGGSPDAATQNLNFPEIPRLYALLRCRYAIVPTANGARTVEIPNPLPRALLVSDYRVVEKRDAIFVALNEANFDPRRTVILEREPSPQSQRGATAGSVGTATIVRADADELVIEAEVTAPAVLLITDLFSSGWRVKALANAGQERYEILPANYILRAVPLAPGRHRLSMEYRPASLYPGIVISGIAGLGWLGGIILLHRRRQTPVIPA